MGREPLAHLGPSEGDPRTSAIRARIVADRLPHAENHAISGRMGDGTRCACCDEPIISAQRLYKAELNDGREFSMHLDCYDKWRQASLSLQRT
jgi:hypothetical protein